MQPYLTVRVTGLAIKFNLRLGDETQFISYKGLGSGKKVSFLLIVACAHCYLIEGKGGENIVGDYCKPKGVNEDMADIQNRSYSVDRCQLFSSDSAAAIALLLHRYASQKIDEDTLEEAFESLVVRGMPSLAHSIEELTSYVKTVSERIPSDKSFLSTQNSKTRKSVAKPVKAKKTVKKSISVPLTVPSLEDSKDSSA